MIVSESLRVRHILYSTWPSLVYFLLLSVGVYMAHHWFWFEISLPFDGIATLSAALAIYLGFKANQAYDRWWEGRKIWGLLVNYSRGFAREVLTFPAAGPNDDPNEVRAWQRRVLQRHLAFVHGLRVFLRKPNGFVKGREELIPHSNEYEDLRPFLDAEEFATTLINVDNVPNQLSLRQGEELREAHDRGWLTDYRFVQMSSTLTEFNNHQGRAERIKNTPLPRPYSFYSRVFVYLHGTLIPFAFIDNLGWVNIPLSLVINFVFLSLDQVGKYTEDPFENRISDVPLTSISLTIESNLKEMAGEKMGMAPPPDKPSAIEGVVF